MLEVSVPGAIVGLLLLVSSAIGQNVSNQHIEYGVTTLHNDQDACPSDDQRNEIRAVISDNVHTLLQTQVLLLLQVDETCTDGFHSCSQLCLKTEGCLCHTGFVLAEDAATCNDVDECADKLDNCAQLCMNTDGGFNCSCRAGFRLAEDGVNCCDIDECREELDNCSQLCNNMEGGFNCSCDEGYHLAEDGAQCDEETSFTGCPFGPDSVWLITWSSTERGMIDTQPCPGGESTIGEATRMCGEDGKWVDPPDLSNCQSLDFIAIEDQVMNLATTEDPEELIMDITTDLTEATEPTEDGVPLLPQDLNTTNSVISSLLDFSEETNITVDPSLIDVFDNILDDSNRDGWLNLQMDGAGSQVLLSNAERFGYILASTENEAEILIMRQNIAIQASQYDLASNISLEVPVSDFNGSSVNEARARVTILPEFIHSKVNGSKDDSVPVVIASLKNLEEFLPSSIPGSKKDTQGASQVVSVQIVNLSTPSPESLGSSDDPVDLVFTVDAVEDDSIYICVFWNFSDPIGSGYWTPAGIQTANVSTTGNITTVHCESSHLTSFAVLVDVAGGNQDISTAESEALKTVSYIGCAISVVSLLASVVILLCLGKTLLESAHNFIHLNLAIALLLGYLLFLGGIETATETTASCVLVAALLQYFFLSAFCWMLCEGIYLYLILVVVFSSFAKKWWLFLLIGWVTPLPIVAVGVGVRHQYYGVEVDRELQYCWLSTEEGTIWGFVAPILAIILVNTVFLMLALRVLLRTTMRKAERKADKKEENVMQLAKALLRGAMILLPLLGVTWVFGVLTLDSNTTVFAWIFTVLNSLQGLAIFVLHVVRNDKVKKRFGPMFSAVHTKIHSNIAGKFEIFTSESTPSPALQRKHTPKSENAVELSTYPTKVLSSVDDVMEPA